MSSLETVDGCVFLRRSHSMKTTVLSPLFPSRVLAPDYVLSTPSHDTRHVHHAHDVENDAHAQWYSSTNSYSPQLPTDHLPHRSCSTRVVWRYTAASAVSSAVSYSVLHSRGFSSASLGHQILHPSASIASGRVTVTPQGVITTTGPGVPGSGSGPLSQPGQVQTYQTHIFAPPVTGAPVKKTKQANTPNSSSLNLHVPNMVSVGGYLRHAFCTRPSSPSNVMLITVC